MSPESNCPWSIQSKNRRDREVVLSAETPSPPVHMAGLWDLIQLHLIPNRTSYVRKGGSKLKLLCSFKPHPVIEIFIKILIQHKTIVGIFKEFNDFAVTVCKFSNTSLHFLSANKSYFWPIALSIYLCLREFFSDWTKWCFCSIHKQQLWARLRKHQTNHSGWWRLLGFMSQKTNLQMWYF